MAGSRKGEHRGAAKKRLEGEVLPPRRGERVPHKGNEAYMREVVLFVANAPPHKLPAEGEAAGHPAVFAGAHSAAMKKGWLERHAPEGRIWLCPSSDQEGEQ